MGTYNAGQPSTVPALTVTTLLTTSDLSVLDDATVADQLTALGLLTANSTLTVNGALDHNGSTAGFMGAAPVVRQTLGAVASDLATVITLANNIRTALINDGLGQA